MRPMLRRLAANFGFLMLPVSVQANAEGISLRIEPEPSETLAKLAGKRPVYAWAESLEGSINQRVMLRGQALLRQAGAVLSADRIDYEESLGELRAEGQVRLARGGTVVQGPALRLQVESQVGAMEDASIAIAAVGGFGAA